MIEKVVKSIKQNEGFKGMPYRDSLGIPTIGYGIKLPISKEEGELLLRYRLNNVFNEIKSRLDYFDNLPEPIQEVLLEMGYQLGVPKLMQFKRMLKAVEERNWVSMIAEMIDSKWYKQTPRRVEKLIEKVEHVL